jgi:hypothetical protein
VAVNNDFTGGVFRRMNSVSAVTITVNTGLTGLEPFTVVQVSTGETLFVAGSGVTIVSADSRMKLRGQNSMASLVPDADDANLYYLVGDLTA